MAKDVAELKLDDFKPYVNGDFAVRIGTDKAGNDVTVTLKLEEAKSVGPQIKGGREGGSFSLHFVGDQHRLAQGIYPVTHATLGTVGGLPCSGRPGWGRARLSRCLRITGPKAGE